MDSSPWLLLLGFVVGTFGTLIGAGGGFILMPILLLLNRGRPPELLTSVSLAVVFANALSGSVAYARLRRIDYRAGLLFAAASVPGAAVGAVATSVVPRRAFDVTFGVVLIAVSAFLLLRKPPPESHDARKPAYSRTLGAALSAGVGVLSSFLGIGGGIIHVPAMVYLLRFPVHVATATSHFVLAIMAAVGTAVHVAGGTLSSALKPTLLLAAGVVPGGQLGAWLSGRVHARWILRSLAAGLGFVGLRILWLGIAA